MFAVLVSMFSLSQNTEISLGWFGFRITHLHVSVRVLQNLTSANLYKYSLCRTGHSGDGEKPRLLISVNGGPCDMACVRANLWFLVTTVTDEQVNLIGQSVSPGNEGFFHFSALTAVWRIFSQITPRVPAASQAV